MAKTKVLVVEDELVVSKDIQRGLKSLGYRVVGSSATGEKAIDLALQKNPDIVLMDIMLKGEMNGIEATEKLHESLGIPVIYITANADQATLEQAKLTQPYGYIIKPFKDIDLKTSIEMALYKRKKEEEKNKERDMLLSMVGNKLSNNFIFVKSNGKLVKINTSDIYFVEALKDYVVINTINKRYTIHSTMKGIVKKLPEKEFARAHRSFIVRIDKIDIIDHAVIILEDGKKTIPVGASYKEQLVKRLNLI